MSKSNKFFGQPIFSQMINLIDTSIVSSVSKVHNSDRYCKRFTTFQHLITMLYGVTSSCNKEAGIVWLERLKNHFKNIVWLNPVEKTEWEYTQSTQILYKFLDEKMFELTPAGIKNAMKTLINPNKTFS